MMINTIVNHYMLMSAKKISISIKLIGITAIISSFGTISIAQTSIEISKTTGSIARPKFTHRLTKIVQLVDAVSPANHRQIWQVAGNPLTPEDYYRSAERKYGKKDYQGALADFDRSISIDPNFAQGYAGRGNVKHTQLQDYRGALADYNQSIQLKPDISTVWFFRAGLKANHLQDYRGALADYSQAIQLEPDYAVAYSFRGDLKVDRLQDYRGALADFNRAISIGSSLAIAYGSRGSLKHDRLKDRAGGIADVQQAARLFKQQGDLENHRTAIGLLKKWQQTSKNLGR
jgi:tetratricopeptide (TPR) repeat protein